MRYCSRMRDDEYRRFHEACLAMAAQSSDTNVRARWLALADTWLKRTIEQHDPYRVVKHESWTRWGKRYALGDN
jgi:hypothetical protein